MHHASRIWDAELANDGIRILSIDPGDMDTPLHALAVPDADCTTLKHPQQAACELITAICDTLARQRAIARAGELAIAHALKHGHRRRHCLPATLWNSVR